ncbi:hypothetical protein DdX_15301 [Ditylenchus destructor]|uniref:Uncharacterized protein n=1 Tax=Ditylenchus destructor TaxID=166010 RepID=A0AAD4MQJ5_9BILA|nr:hypothetical protein DdX_15301 [Ditylenchus destructor]
MVSINTISHISSTLILPLFFLLTAVQSAVALPPGIQRQRQYLSLSYGNWIDGLYRHSKIQKKSSIQPTVISTVLPTPLPALIPKSPEAAEMILKNALKNPKRRDLDLTITVTAIESVAGIGSMALTKPQAKHLSLEQKVLRSRRTKHSLRIHRWY